MLKCVSCGVEYTRSLQSMLEKNGKKYCADCFDREFPELYHRICEEEELFWCYKCHKRINEVNIDGYFFGDRMLEGVMYRVENRNGKPWLLGISYGKEVIQPKDDPYMHKLNNEYWNKACIEFAEGTDIAQCPDCGDDVLVWGG